MENEIAVKDIEPKVLSAVEVGQQVQAIQQVMKGVMQQGTHYGTVPGCGDKPTLLKAGAEKIMMTFRLGVDPEIENLSNSDCLRYRVRARIFNTMTGVTLGYGVGEASTDETKYKWREALGAEFEATDPARRRVKYGKDYTTNQVRTEIADQANTVLKMAKKRALVDGILTVTDASDIFTQDLEDMPEETRPKKETLETTTKESYTVLADPIPEDYKEKKAEYKAKGYGCKQFGKEWKWVRYNNAAQPAAEPEKKAATAANQPMAKTETKLSEATVKNGIEMMNEMDYSPVIQKARLAWGNTVGDKKFLDNIENDYENFLSKKSVPESELPY